MRKGTNTTKQPWFPCEERWGFAPKPIEVWVSRVAPAYSQEAVAIVVVTMAIAVFYTAWRIITIVCT